MRVKERTSDVINPYDLPVESLSISRTNELVETPEEVARAGADVQNLASRLKEGEQVL